MLDLNNLIHNSNTSIDPSVNVQENSELELKDDLENNDNQIDPSSFMLLFSEILANNSPDKSDVNTKTDASVTNSDEIQKSANQITKMNNVPIDKDSSDLTPENQQNTTELLFDNPINTLSKSDPQALDILEDNVALAWINAEGFEPPQAMASEIEMDDELVQELEAQLTDAEKLINKLLKKEINSQNYTDIGAIKKAPINEQSIDEKPLKDQININTKEDLFNSINSSSTTTSFTPSEPVSSGIVQTSNIDNLVLDNTQNMIQPGAIARNENQNSILGTETKSLEIPVDISNSQWSEKFSEHIVWLGNHGIKSAIIKIHPDDLGPLEISIKVVKDSASVNINSPSSHVCEIVDQALPRLREMMAEQGLNLSEVNIGTDTNSQQSSQNSQNSDDAFMIDSEDEILLTPLTKKSHQGLIDYFA